MSLPILRFGFREPSIDTNRPFVDGTVKIEGFELETSNFRGPDLIDAWDASFGLLMTTKDRGEHPYVSIPAFPNRKFRLSYIFVNSAAGINGPRDLEGKRVGVFAWDNTAGVWERGALQDHYGVDFTRVTWCIPGRDKGWAPGIRVEPLPKECHSNDAAFDELLTSGKLDAVLVPNVLPSFVRKDPRVRRLFPDYKAEEQAYFKATGIFPISHVVTLKQEFVARHPEAPMALLNAYRKARDVAFERICGSDPEIVTISWATAAIDEQRAVMGDDYWPYTVEGNARTLDAMMDYAHRFGITAQKHDYRSLFHPETLAASCAVTAK
jgi:4,5-dihydroxyphthalate decarboxylase